MPSGSASCACGATITVQAQWASHVRAQIADFLKAHEACRAARASDEKP